MIEHKIPTIEERLAIQTALNDKVKELIDIHENAVKELRKEFNSGRLVINELNLMKGLRDKKFALLDTTTMKFIEPKFI